MKDLGNKRYVKIYGWSGYDIDNHTFGGQNTPSIKKKGDYNKEYFKLWKGKYRAIFYFENNFQI